MVAPTPGPAIDLTKPVAPTGASGMIPAEWPAQAADAIVDTIGKVRDKTTRPAIVAARAVVYGFIAAVVGIIAAILALILLVRLYDNYVPGHVWPLYAVLFAVFTFGGVFCLRKANAPAPSA